MSSEDEEVSVPQPYNEEDLWDDELEAIAGREKSKALAYSRRLDVHTWSDHPEVNKFVDPIYDKSFKSRKKNIEKKHLKVVLLDLYVAWVQDPKLKISFSRNHTDYDAGTIYNELSISRLTIEVVDILIEAGLVEQAKGFYPHGQGEGRIARIWPSKVLIEMFMEARFSPFDIRSIKDRLTVILRDTDQEANKSKPKTKKTVEIEYELTEETERMSSVLNKYNDLLWHTFIDIPSLEDTKFDVEVDGEAKTFSVGQLDKFTRRIFNRGSFECGGRFWGGWWQRCKKDLRPHIFINNHPTIEVDFSGFHIIMLYAEEKINYWKHFGTDPYELPDLGIFENSNQQRSTTKLLFLMLLNAKSEGEAYNAFRQNSENGTPEKRLTNDQLSKIKAALEEKHPHIRKHFCADVGVRLMNKDAQITEVIIETFCNHNIPVLSVHDSYIVPEGYVDELISTMCIAFEKVMGIPLTGLEQYAMKENKVRLEYLFDALMSWMPYDDVPGQD
ncbi:MAG: hypothetical protein HOM51_19700, partial [Rhodospirillaceae bacterium]|nr:hypothetical protein [Rhodospirillaceae bacterium]